MILRCTNTSLASDERELRAWLAKELGEADESAITRMFSEHWPTNELHYVEGLKEIVTVIGRAGKAAAHPFIEMARQPKERREFQMDVSVWIGQHLPARLAKIAAHRGAREAVEGERDAFLFEMESYLQRMYSKHRATMKGAMAAALRFVPDAPGREIQVDVAVLTKTLFMPDPLAATAAQSRLS